MVAIHIDSFARYAPIGNSLVASAVDTLDITYLTAEYGQKSNGNGLATLSIGEGRFAGSAALSFATQTSNLSMSLGKALGANYSRALIGFGIKSSQAAPAAHIFYDNTTAQLTVLVSALGKIEVRRGGTTGTLLGTSTEVLSPDTWYYIEADVTFSQTVGAVTVWLNGVATSIALTSQDTCATANEYTNRIDFQCNHASGANNTASFTDYYLFDTTGATDNAIRGDTRIECLTMNGDDSTMFTVGAAVFGAKGARVTGASTTAPGANQLYLRKFRTGPACTLDSIKILPGATSAGAKNKAVLYNDNGSGTAPSGAAVATGTEVVGLTSGTVATFPFASGQSLSADTIYWIGYFTDTSVALRRSDVDLEGYTAANTYGSGAPSSPSMTSGIASLCVWGVVSGLSAANYYPVGQGFSVGDNAYIAGANANDEDYFTVADLSNTPTSIGAVKISAYVKKTDAGARTVDLKCKSGVSTTTGTASGFTPGTDYGFVSTFVATDPATSAAWSAAGINAMKSGIKVAS